VGVRKFNLPTNPIKKEAVVDLNPFPPLQYHFFYFLIFDSVAEKKLFFGRRNIGEGGICPPSTPPQVTPLPR
jgi:hypothetical protein